MCLLYYYRLKTYFLYPLNLDSVQINVLTYTKSVFLVLIR